MLEAIYLITIIIIAFLVNKYIDKRYGTITADLIKRIESIESNSNLKLKELIDSHDLQLKAVNKRIDGFIVGKII